MVSKLKIFSVLLITICLSSVVFASHGVEDIRFDYGNQKKALLPLMSNLESKLANPSDIANYNGGPAFHEASEIKVTGTYQGNTITTSLQNLIENGIKKAADWRGGFENWEAPLKWHSVNENLISNEVEGLVTNLFSYLNGETSTETITFTIPSGLQVDFYDDPYTKGEWEEDGKWYYSCYKGKVLDPNIFGVGGYNQYIGNAHIGISIDSFDIDSIDENSLSCKINDGKNPISVETTRLNPGVTYPLFQVITRKQSHQTYDDEVGSDGEDTYRWSIGIEPSGSINVDLTRECIEMKKWSDLGKVKGGIRHNLIHCQDKENSETDKFCPVYYDQKVAYAHWPEVTCKLTLN
jgi:hypothetical protein